MRKLIILCFLLSACGSSGGEDAKIITGFTNQNEGRIVLSRPWANYEYAPSILKENGTYIAYWCARDDRFGGDTIYRADSVDFVNWSTPTPVLTRGKYGFDRDGVCDPSIIKVDGVYYLYYGGYNQKGTPWTQLGVATSTDSFLFTKYGSNPIITSKYNIKGYGAGQPSIIFKEGEYQLLYHDSTFYGYDDATTVLARSESPFFETYTSEFMRRGVSIEWCYHQKSYSYVLVNNFNVGVSSIRTYSETLEAIGGFNIPNINWTEGSGFAKDEYGYCGDKLEYMYSVGVADDPFSYDLHTGSVEFVYEAK